MGQTRLVRGLRREPGLLWDALAKEGGVMSARLAHEDTGTARVAGNVADDCDDEV